MMTGLEIKRLSYLTSVLIVDGHENTIKMLFKYRIHLMTAASVDSHETQYLFDYRNFIKFIMLKTFVFCKALEFSVPEV